MKILDVNIRLFVPFCFFAAVLAPWGEGQVLATEEGAGQYQKSFYTVNDGHTQNEITAIVQDTYRFMWLRIHGGLNRFDGYEFLKFKPAPEIYDLAHDTGEKKDMAPENGRNSERLESVYRVWKTSAQDPVFLGLLRDDAYSRRHPDRFSIPGPGQPDRGAPVIREGYRLIWAEEFNEDGRPDTTKWSFEQGFVRNQELQWYQPENAVVQDGCLVITGKREKVDNPEYNPDHTDWRRSRPSANYTSASLNTREKFSFMYGMMEVRARIDTAMGSWPAIWTLGVDRRWPFNGEVDVMEYYRVDNHPTVLANAAWGEKDKRRPTWDDVKIPFSAFLDKDPHWPEKFHTWKMEWDSTSIRLYVDEHLLNEVDVEVASCTDGFNPFRQPHYILLNLALGSKGGDPSDTRFPLYYEVDYVRIYEVL